MNDKNNPLIADSSATTLQRVSEALNIFEETINHSVTPEDIDNLQRVREALAQAIEDGAVPDRFEPQESALTGELTADTLEGVLHVLSALHLTFETFNESNLFSPPIRSAFAGFALTLAGVEEALQFEVARNSRVAAEGRNNE